MQSQQLPTESQVLEDEVLPGTESADQPAEEMSKRHNHGKNYSGKNLNPVFRKSFILRVYEVLARHRVLLADLDYLTTSRRGVHGALFSSSFCSSGARPGTADIAALRSLKASP